jgi:hypothetical protein
MTEPLRLAWEPFRTTRMSTSEIVQDFPDGQEINQVMNGKKPMPSDAALRMVYQVQIDRQQEKKERLEAAKNPPAASTMASNDASADHSTMSAGAPGNEIAAECQRKGLSRQWGCKSRPPRFRRR